MAVWLRWPGGAGPSGIRDGQLGDSGIGNDEGFSGSEDDEMLEDPLKDSEGRQGREDEDNSRFGERGQNLGL